VRPKYSLDQKRSFAAAMRAKPTDAEAAMWQLVRGDRLGTRFRRQITLWGWIVDFYCPTLRLVIEVDGSAHDSIEARVRDQQKETTLTEHGIKVLRFDNEDVLGFPRVVFMRIYAECELRKKARLGLRGVGLPSSYKHPVVVTVSCASLQNSVNSKRVSGMSSRGLCTTSADVKEIPGNRQITPEEYEQLMQRVVTLSRQRSMNFCAPDNRSAEEKAADLRYRFDEHVARKAKRA
jgi:very-short-patch-repair endonuclease